VYNVFMNFFLEEVEVFALKSRQHTVAFGAS
jgi:hypothetical protein